MSEPLTGEKVGLLQQDYIRFLFESDDMFNNVTIIAEDEGDIGSQMDKALGIITVKDSAAGACVIVRQPTGTDGMPGVLWPPLTLAWEILFLEWRSVNKDTNKGGTGKRAWHMARRGHRILKAHRAPGIVQCFTPRNPCISRASYVRELNGIPIPLVGYQLNVNANEADNTAYQKVALPVMTADNPLSTDPVKVGTVGSVVTLSCTTAGSQIYYTSDLSNPCSQNSAAILYSAPFTISSAATIMVRAFATDYIGSDAIAATFS